MNPYCGGETDTTEAEFDGMVAEAEPVEVINTIPHEVRSAVDIWHCTCGEYWDISLEAEAREHEATLPPFRVFTAEEMIRDLRLRYGE